MADLRDFMADLLEREGAAVDPAGPDLLEVLAPPPLRERLGLPEMALLAFGAERPAGAVPVGLDGDWLERVGALLGERGRRAVRMVVPEVPPPADPERLLGHALDLPNAVWRLKGAAPAWTRYRLLSFRYTALSDEKREGVLRLGLNMATGALLDGEQAALWDRLAADPDWRVPTAEALRAAPSPWPAERVDALVRAALPPRLSAHLAPFLRSLRRRLDRDRDRLHEYHQDLHREATKRLAAARDDAERQRETARLEAIAREYAGKLDDLRHNYALALTVERVQALDLILPVHRLSVLIRRRKGERVVSLDWNPLLRQLDPPPVEAGAGLERARLVCDERLHLTDVAAQGPCPSCGKPFCRACHARACPKCGHSVQAGDDAVFGGLTV
ncbi:hypothetical protein [Azospirillum sp. sgz302134]